MKIQKKSINILISYWLLIIFFLISLIIIVGGLTRLTDSGLSITKWELFSGILPPLSSDKWDTYFKSYNWTQTSDKKTIIFNWVSSLWRYKI